MKDKKPFKLGATYKLKRKCVNKIEWTFGMRHVFGETPHVFTFTTSEIDGGSVWGMLSGDRDYWMLIPASDRVMYKRIDNK